MEKQERTIKITKVNGFHAEEVKRIEATSLREALTRYYKTVLWDQGHVGPLYLGNHMSTVKHGERFEYIAVEVYQTAHVPQVCSD